MSGEKGTKENPWKLKTSPLTSEYEMHKDEKEILVCTVGKTVLHYDYRCIEDLYTMLKNHGDWMLLGSADEQKPPKEGTVEAWGRSPENPIGGWYGLKKGLRGRFGIHTSFNGGTRTCGNRAQSEKQSDESAITLFFSGSNKKITGKRNVRNGNLVLDTQKGYRSFSLEEKFHILFYFKLYQITLPFRHCHS